MVNQLIKIIQIKQPRLKKEITNDILRSLHKWFSIEKAIVDYSNSVKDQIFFAVYDKEKPCGFISTKLNNQFTAEITVMGVLEEYQSNGLGKKLLKATELYLKKQKIKFLMVKTLSSKKKDKFYEKTRKFYLASGFYPLIETDKVWGKENPCLILVKAI